MQTASGPAVTDGSKRDPGSTRSRLARRRPVRPIVWIIGGLFVAAVLLSMAVVFTGIWPPKADKPTVAAQWHAQRTATPAAQRAAGLKVEKLGAPRLDGDTVVVRLKVTNEVKVSAAVPGTPTPSAATPTAAPANVYNGTIYVIFYNVEPDGTQVIAGAGNGNVVDLPYGQSKEIEVRANSVRDFTDKTQYEAFPDTVWTDKDPVKGEGGSSGQGTTPAANPTP